ncbi:MAG: hypothetical protein OXH71_03565 [Candidatus Dadabacteria bacterium]|nr:hypothetical protein [Candidatus Dadabacteria bacterium]MDE0519756.1 hypothetical protein [Candidatus Dadabacteria bacterium]MDE0663052.1 hypothetical protein [Candidatus Dadabacteria bacterium]
MNIDSLIDFTNEATKEIAKYKRDFILSQPKMIKKDKKYIISTLDWNSVSYGPAEVNKVPNDKRGIYAFAICQKSAVLPPHGYILYIGIAGRDSKRSLRKRYKDYLNEHEVRKRDGIARMIGTWHKVLRFFFAPVDDNVSSDDLKKLEQQLNTALMPPFSINDLEADTKRKIRAFK